MENITKNVFLNYAKVGCDGDSSHHLLQNLPVLVHAQTMLVSYISSQDAFCMWFICLMPTTGLGSHKTKSAPPHLHRCRQGCMYLPPQLLGCVDTEQQHVFWASAYKSVDFSPLIIYL